MKTTMKAILTDLTNEQKALLDNMMLVFCTAIRYSFNEPRWLWPDSSRL